MQKDIIYDFSLADYMQLELYIPISYKNCSICTSKAKAHLDNTIIILNVIINKCHQKQKKIITNLIKLVLTVCY